MLVDNQIKEEIRNGNIKIDPYDEKKILVSSYDFSLGNILLLPDEGQKVSIVNGPNPTYTKIDITNQPYVIKPGQFLLGQTLEELTFSNDIAMLIDGKTAIARLGLSIHITATLIKPGHTSSIITLEIFNAGNMEIELAYGMPIGKGMFFKSSKPSDRSYKESGTYPSQKEAMGADLSKFMKSN